jgi:hypothetical protein
VALFFAVEVDPVDAASPLVFQYPIEARYIKSTKMILPLVFHIPESLSRFRIAFDPTFKPLGTLCMQFIYVMTRCTDFFR